MIRILKQEETNPFYDPNSANNGEDTPALIRV